MLMAVRMVAGVVGGGERLVMVAGTSVATRLMPNKPC